ncbi:FhaA domain-containing protein [Actinomyces vulturis]|uniref:FhaA domain-containing protein n=1 Tax=Actinomyces vulturis TaxID=1857645 RepID=UPI00082C7516|nr:DUF3662 and FHA domain-containing protein [Actinomyces vulturis]
MGLFDRFEKGVENVTNRALSTFASDVEPIEISSKVKETMDKRAATFARDRSVVPNVYAIKLSPHDHNRVIEWGKEEMINQIADVITTHAHDQGYSFVGPINVSISANEELSSPTITVETSVKRGASAPAAAAIASRRHPIIDVGGQRYVLTGSTTIIGRGSEADIIVDDSGVSRRHLELTITNDFHTIATDLQSTNGTFVEGHRIEQATLVDGNTIKIGRTTIMFFNGDDEVAG